VDIEVTGATAAAIELAGDGVSLVGADVHDNPGVAILIRANAAPRIVNSTFARNGAPERGVPPLVIEPRAHPRLSGNVFRGVEPDVFRVLDARARQDLVRDNWFAGVHGSAVAPPPVTPRTPPSSRRPRPRP